MIRTKKQQPPKAFDRVARDALKASPTRLVTNTGLNRAAYRGRMRAARLAQPSAAPAPAPLSRRQVVRLRSETVRAHAAAASAVSRG